MAASLIAIALLTSFGLLDWVLFPDRLSLLLKWRAACVAMLLLALPVLRGTMVRRNALWAGLGLSVLLGLMVDVIVLCTGGAASPYYAGNGLILMGMAVLLPWPPAWSLLSSSLIVGTYAAIILWSSPTDPRLLANALAFLGSMSIIAVVSSAISERLRRREFEGRVALAEALDHKSKFLASVSHDLRTPLNVVVGYVQLLEDEEFGPVTPAQRDVLGRVLRSAGSQLGLINDLLDLARIEQGNLAFQIRPVMVRDLVPALREMMEVLLHDRPVTFEVDVGADTVVRADPERLRQALTNLLTNAAKFTQVGSIRLAATRTAGSVSISVSDTGPGMDPDVRARALEPFVRGDGPHAGWGLGLAIVSQLARLLDGTVEIENTPARGTSVHLRLPAAENGDWGAGAPSTLVNPARTLPTPLSAASASRG